MPNALQIHRSETATDLEFALAQTLYEIATTLGRRIEFLTFPGEHGRSYTLRPSASALAETAPGADSPPVLESIQAIADSHLPYDVEIEPVTLDLDPVGTAAAPVERLLRTTTASTTATPAGSPATRLLTDDRLQATPFFYQLVVAPTSTADLAISVRFCQFDPEYRMLTRDETAASYDRPGQPTLASHLETHSLTTTHPLHTERGWQVRHEDRLPGPAKPLLELEPDARRDTSQTTRIDQLHRSPIEYQLLLEPAPEPVLRDEYTTLNVDPWIFIDADDLPAFCDLTTTPTPTSPWASVPGRTQPATPPQPATANGSSPAENRVQQLIERLEDDANTQFIRHGLTWLREHGDEIEPRPATPLAVPTFTRHRPRGDTELVIAVTQPRAFKGELVTAMKHALEQTDGLTVLTPSLEAGQHAARTLLEPVADPAVIDRALTPLYSRPLPLSNNQGIAVRPREQSSVRWTLTPDNELHALIDGDVVLTATPPISLDSIAGSFDQVPLNEITETARSSTGSEHDTKPDIVPIREPALPGTLAAALDDATVFAQDNSQFVEVRPTASWDDQRISFREHAAATALLDRFTVHEPNAAIAIDAVRPQLAAWIRHQTDEALSSGLKAPIRLAYNEVSPTPQSLSESIDHLPNRAWRYQPFSDH